MQARPSLMERGGARVRLVCCFVPFAHKKFYLFFVFLYLLLPLLFKKKKAPLFNTATPKDVKQFTSGMRRISTKEDFHQVGLSRQATYSDDVNLRSRNHVVCFFPHFEPILLGFPFAFSLSRKRTKK